MSIVDFDHQRISRGEFVSAPTAAQRNIRRANWVEIEGNNTLTALLRLAQGRSGFPCRIPGRKEHRYGLATCFSLP